MHVLRRWLIAGAATTLIAVGAVVAGQHSGVGVAAGSPGSTASATGPGPIPPSISVAPSPSASATGSATSPASAGANGGQPNESLRPSSEPTDERVGKQLGTPFTVNGIAVVSAKHRVNGSFQPKVTGSYPLAPVAAKAFASMSAAMRRAKLSVHVVSGYRSHASQAALYRHALAAYGRAYTTRYVAVPGTSEHQSGLAVDLRSPSGRGSTFDNTREWRWLRAHAQDYGFVLRYPNGLTKVTGIGFEPWHWRYVGVAQAKAIRGLGANTTIEQYLRLA